MHKLQICLFAYISALIKLLILLFRVAVKYHLKTKKEQIQSAEWSTSLYTSHMLWVMFLLYNAHLVYFSFFPLYYDAQIYFLIDEQNVDLLSLVPRKLFKG